MNNSTISIARKHSFEMAHRIMDHPGKCLNIHGHSYNIEMVFEGMPNQMGMVLDFSKVKEIFCSWIDEEWDHQLAMYNKDPLAIKLAHVLQEEPCANVVMLPFNPTAENMADYLLNVIFPHLIEEHNLAIRCTMITINETAKCAACCIKV